MNHYDVIRKKKKQQLNLQSETLFLLVNQTYAAVR